MRLITPPVSEPVTVADAKAAARLDGSHWDGIVASAIAAARQVAEHQTGLRLMQQVWRLELQDWPAPDANPTPMQAPTAVAVSYWSTGNAWVSLSAPSYVWVAVDQGLQLVPALGTSWPALGEVAAGPRVRVDVTLGVTDQAAVPPCVVQFIKALVSVMAADPTLTATDAMASSAYLPRMLDPARTYLR